LLVKSPKLLALALFALPATAMVASAAPADVMKARHHNFEIMGRALKSLLGELRKRAPNLALVQARANTLAAASQRVGSDFPKGTGPETGRKTHALPAIWQRPAEFAKAADANLSATRGLQAAAASGDLPRIRAAANHAAKTCKGCHDQFREPE